MVTKLLEGTKQKIVEQTSEANGNRTGIFLQTDGNTVTIVQKWPAGGRRISDFLKSNPEYDSETRSGVQALWSHLGTAESFHSAGSGVLNIEKESNFGTGLLGIRDRG